ncbi:MAG: EamA family transporter [Rhodospirillales bacterium]|nr:EamA family transporter [Rhodospirillales bacterium]MCW8861181.1 EamA family transporter [Rhodospirillales bacterium]MCW8951909.1 EamA family transporter [Rhodospirillales bacterium]MCW8971057.1 EamA family transporter [Rhodospirillales bacterium]MCW9002652.1 EamA family transporter [Rhodospirillales bacterium]
MNVDETSRRGVINGTLIGAVALVLWSTLGILTVASGQTPPFLLVSMSFAVAFAIALIKWIVRAEPPLRHFRQPPAAWVIGVSGLFGYHFLYFLALRNADPVSANLVNYLWPLLIVLFSAMLPGERLRWWHVAGALAGFTGTAVLMAGKGDIFVGGGLTGFAAAFGAGITWAAYSVLSRRFGSVPTDAVGWFCAVGSLLALLCHLAFEETIWPQGYQWLAVLAMGLGPAGGAFFFWDHGVKKGDIRMLGTAAYLVPLLSTLLLVVAGAGQADWRAGVACLLIVGGAALASRDFFRR